MQTKFLLASYQQALVPSLLLLMSGAFAASSLSLPPGFWLAWLLVGGICFLACLLFAPQRHSLRWFLWFVCFFLGGVYFSLFHFQPDARDVSRWYGQSQQVSVQGTVIGRGSSKNQWVFAVETANGEKASGRALIRLPKLSASTSPLQIGQRIQAVGYITLPRAARFPGGFDYRAYLLQQKITALLYVKDYHSLTKRSSSWWLKLLALTDRIRDRINTHFKEHLPSPEAEIFASVVLGEHAVGMDRSIKQQFRNAGLIHVLAASGLNVGLIGFFFLFLGNVFRFPLRISLSLAMLGVAFYCLLTGLPPSVQRAGLMFELALLLKFIDRELTPVMLLSLAGVVLTLINPMIVSMLGFQLSFLSTFGLIVMVPPLQEKLGFYITQWGAGLLLVPLIAQLWVTPILWYHFNQVQLLSLPANLLALPIVAFMTYLGFVFGGLSLFIPSVTGWLLEHTGFLCTGLKTIASFFGALPFATWNLPSPPAPTVVLMFGGLMLLAYGLNFPVLLPRRKVLLALTVSLLLMVLPGALAKWHAQQHVTLTWLSTERGAEIQIIRTPKNTVVVNCANLSSYQAKDLETYLRKQGITRIQLLNIVSPHMANASGIHALVQAIPVQQITILGNLITPRVQEQLIQATTRANVPIISLAPTHLIKGKDIHGIFLTAYPMEALQRFDVGSTCLVNHWGDIRLVESLFYSAAQGCSIIQDAAEGTYVSIATQTNEMLMPLYPFKRVAIASEKVRIFK